jgi:hypothetical protein
MPGCIPGAGDHGADRYSPCMELDRSVVSFSPGTPAHLNRCRADFFFQNRIGGKTPNPRADTGSAEGHQAMSISLAR